MSEQIDKLWDCIYRMRNTNSEMASERFRQEMAEFEELINDIEELKILCKELLNGADKCSQEPHYIVQPFLGIVKRYSKIIEKYKLLD